MRLLPSLRRKIRRVFLMLILIYAVLGILLMIAVRVASSTSPTLLHKNYDILSASSKMREAWNALDQPHRYAEKPRKVWLEQFEKALQFEEANVTDPEEKEAVQKIRTFLKRYLVAPGRVDRQTFQEMREMLKLIDADNEREMFELAHRDTRLSQGILVGASIYLVLSIILVFVFADSIAGRLAEPLKSIAEALQTRPPMGKKLRLPEADSLEVLILNQELTRLWEQVGQTERLNLGELTQEKSKLETVLESVEDSLIVVDNAGRVTHCNQMLLKLIGLAKEMVVGNFWRDLPTNDEDYLKLRTSLHDKMPEGYELELKVGDRRRQYSARFRTIEGPDGKVAATLFLLHDITEKRQRDHLRSELIELLSHELRTPLQSLGTATEILRKRRESLPDDLKLLVDTVSEDHERIRAVANEFVQVTQTHAKILKMKLERVALNEVMVDWLKPFQVIAKDRGVTIDLVTEGSEVIYANIDTVKFPWVISNLISNALRFSPKGGTVTMKVTDRYGSVEIHTEDEGPGVPIEDRARIFEPFFQAKVPTLDGTRGLFGVGLTIAKEVVEAHDGRLEYQANDPHGSVFKISLPYPEIELG